MGIRKLQDFMTLQTPTDMCTTKKDKTKFNKTPVFRPDSEFCSTKCNCLGLVIYPCLMQSPHINSPPDNDQYHICPWTQQWLVTLFPPKNLVVLRQRIMHYLWITNHQRLSLKTHLFHRPHVTMPKWLKQSSNCRINAATCRFAYFAKLHNLTTILNHHNS